MIKSDNNAYRFFYDYPLLVMNRKILKLINEHID